MKQNPYNNPSKKGGGQSDPVRDSAPSPDSEEDYTSEVLAFLQDLHGKVRQDSQGDYHYQEVSSISLHFLLRSRLPKKEILWGWYQYFDQERSESIYRTLGPLEDEEFLEVLAGADFKWNARVVRESGLVFLAEHAKEVFLALEEFLSMRLDAINTMNDQELRKLLTTSTWTSQHIKKLVRKFQFEPLDPSQRRAVYSLFDSDYQRATAARMLHSAAREHFWKKPPPELRAFQAQCIILEKTLRATAERMGLYVDRQSFERSGFNRARAKRAWRPTDAPRSQPGQNGTVVLEHFTALGLDPSASLTQVKSAYREKVKAYHPDQGGTVQEFLRLQEAYEFLVTQVFSEAH